MDCILNILCSHSCKDPKGAYVKKESPQGKIIIEHEANMKNILHKYCPNCHSVSLNLIIQKSRTDQKDRCQQCSFIFQNGKERNYGEPEYLPIWKNNRGRIQFNVPKCLQDMTDGEKLLIQLLSPFVPLQHLSRGAHGCQGHVCCFPQDIDEVCSVLPRKQSCAVRIIKGYTKEDGTVGEKIFSIRKHKVLDALRWLKKNNRHYQHITIDESNLNWMGNEEEKELEVETIYLGDENCDIETEPRHEGAEEVYGIIQKPTGSNIPNKKDNDVTDAINEALRSEKMRSKKKKGNNSNNCMNFPFVHEKAVSEYDDNEEIFAKAFPWLFPGGDGDVNMFHNDRPYEGNEWIKFWIHKMLYFKDGRFAKDRMWCFYVLNYWQRHINQSQGGYFVEKFDRKKIASLEELKFMIENGDKEWVSRICYFSNRVTGSPAYWRERRSELYSWINYHIYKGNGPPSAFMTLSCAEHHWPNIERLIRNRCGYGNIKVPKFNQKGGTKWVNEFTLVIQEYFQKKVEDWLKTIGKECFKIKYYWLRYEFAPGRGQIHAHLLLIMDMQDVWRLVHFYQQKSKTKNDIWDTQVKNILGDYIQREWQMTAQLPISEGVKKGPGRPKKQKRNHPASEEFTDQFDTINDSRKLLETCQYHVCSDYCMKKRKYL